MTYIVFAFLALLSSSLNTIFNRISSHKVSTVLSAALKSLFIVLACFIIVCCFGHIDILYSFTGEQWIWIGVLGLLTSVNWIFYFRSIKKAYLEAFAPFETSTVLFLSNAGFSILMFDVVTKGGSTLNTILFFAGLAFMLCAILFIVFSKKLNPSGKRFWVIYATLTAAALAASLIVVKMKLSDVPSDIISFQQMTIVLLICVVFLLSSKSGRKEFLQLHWRDYARFAIAAVFNVLLMIFRYKALSINNSVPSIVNCIISLDFVLVGVATVLFFKAKDKRSLLIVIILVTAGMILNVLSGLI